MTEQPSRDLLRRRLASALNRRDANKPGTAEADRWSAEVRRLRAELTAREPVVHDCDPGDETCFCGED
jgi:hypothetical protein